MAQAHLIKLADTLDHLNCPPAHLEDRIASAEKLLAMPMSGEPSVRKAREILARANGEARSRLAALA